jgi:hypothetical protein
MKSVIQVVTISLLMLILQAPAAVIAAPVIVVENNPVTVFADAQRCESLDIPDAPMRAFRRADGMVVAFATHYLNRALIGPSLAQLSHDCRLVYQGKHLVDPAQFDDRTWVAATWTFDGVTVSALGHNEYHADHFPGHCQFATYRECQYNAIVPLSSSDGGRSFARTHYPAPIAAPPMKSDVDQGRPRGYVNPSNIVFHDGYYYTLIGRSDLGGKKAGRCLFRTQGDGLIRPTLVHVDIGPTIEWGQPSDSGTRNRWPNYHDSIWTRSESSDADVYMIDGRFRVACFMQVLLHSRRDALIMIHDFDFRNEYHVVREVAREIAVAGSLSLFVRRGDRNETHIREILAAHEYDPA